MTSHIEPRAEVTVPDAGSLMQRILPILEISDGAVERLEAICKLMRAELPGYDWVGFYLVDPNSPRELVLGPFAGAPTEHTRITFGQGICGQAAEREATFLIEDVTEESNYLSCGSAVKSEIVVPIYMDEKIVGELDIDSHRKACFGDEDRRFCESLAERLGGLCDAARHETMNPGKDAQ